MESLKDFFKETRGMSWPLLRTSIFQFSVVDGFMFDTMAAVVVLVINSFVPLVRIHPVKRSFLEISCCGAYAYSFDFFGRYLAANDPEINYPDVDDTISGTQLSILMLVIPMGTFVVSLFIFRSLADFHHSFLTLLEGFSLVVGFKHWMNLVGRYRPNYFAMLATNDPEADNGNQSYPSGHASYMFVSMTITTLYLLGKSQLFVRPFRGAFAAFTVALSPIMLATFVAVTRPADYKHHFSDINAGMFIGLSLGSFCYFLNYHSLFGDKSGQPKLRSFEDLAERSVTWSHLETPDTEHASDKVIEPESASQSSVNRLPINQSVDSAHPVSTSPAR